tara:strand:- start:40 stop:909 length:870 start_codon:yes stop_codon:yes gene_type:complete
MPELPEVEVVKRSLSRKILNLIIKKVKINDGNLRYKVNTRLLSKLVGKKIKKIERRSKFLILYLDKKYSILVHLGMTGKFFFINKKNEKFKTSFYYSLNKNKDQKHNRLIFTFKNNQKLIYNDIRKFGFIKILDILNLYKNMHLKDLGPEPFEKDCNFNYFKKYISGRNRNIKDVLMDQKFIAGLGNIYVNEALFLSGINPARKVKNLKDFEISIIIQNIKKVLKTAIRLGGSSIKDFSSSDGKSGIFQQHFKVYGRKGEKCSNVDCNKNITRTVISNRATFFCKKCQK